MYCVPGHWNQNSGVGINVALVAYQGRRKDFSSGPAVIGACIWNAVCNGARVNIYNEFH